MLPFVIYNPIAGGGTTLREWSAISAKLRESIGEFESVATRGPGEARTLAAEACRSGRNLVVAVGGDGTISEVADGMLSNSNKSRGESVLAIVPTGSGNDFARGLGISGWEAAIERIRSGEIRWLDAGRVTYRGDSGEAGDRRFSNIASFGVSGAIGRAINAGKKRNPLGAKSMYLFQTIAGLLRYTFQDARIQVDDHFDITLPVAAVIVANGKYFGGGMQIAPDASLDDGLFDVVIVRAHSKLQLILALRHVYAGTHTTHPAFMITRGKKVVASPVRDDGASPILIEVDGETPGRLAATFEMLPKTLAVRL